MISALRRRLLLGCVVLALAACNQPQHDPERAAYSTEIRWTAYGIPHVKAGDWGSLGYGFAYATARDAVCVIARELVRMDGEMSLHFGAQADARASDVFHRAMLQPQRIAAYRAGESADSTAFSLGYVEGYNRFLADHEGKLPASCNGQQWVRSMVPDDVARLGIGVGIRYGLGRFAEEMAAAAPPTQAGESTAVLHTDFDSPRGYGSNAVALGREVTQSGRGILFGNPHYPWEGPSRFHMIHTTIPGEVDVMGVSLLITPRIAIGFNADVAWSHTVSTALRSTFYQLQLNPDNPMQYRYGDHYRDIQQLVVSTLGIGEDGAPLAGKHTVYFSHYGPVVESKELPWNQHFAYAVRDANLENLRTAATYDALAKATSTKEVEAAISLQGVSWTNTVAADKQGNAFYADISVTPNVDVELLKQCRIRPAGVPGRAIVLAGDRAACEWKQDARSAIPGALPAQEMPRLHRLDYVSNSNDSYWLSNPQQPLEGFSPVIGNEREARSLRTRAGLVFLEEKLGEGSRISAADMQAMLYHHRNHGAELLLDDLLTLCENLSGGVDVDGQRLDVSRSCSVLKAWDRRNSTVSRGGHVWREFWREARTIENRFSQAFEVQRPVHTPAGLAIDDPDVRQALLVALARAQLTLERANIALDATLGDIQYTERNGKRIPVAGGEGWAGMWSMIIAGLEQDKGYTPIKHGNSYIQVISWTEQGTLVPRGVLTYAQSPEADSPHNADMTRVYSAGGWVEFPFTDAEIAADPELVSLKLVQ